VSMIKSMAASLERAGWSLKSQLVAAAAILLLPSCFLVIISAYARYTDEINSENSTVQRLAEDIAIDTSECTSSSNWRSGHLLKCLIRGNAIRLFGI
jgi:hypothetical protein